MCVGKHVRHSAKTAEHTTLFLRAIDEREREKERVKEKEIHLSISLGLVDVINPQQQTVVHDSKALQNLAVSV